MAIGVNRRYLLVITRSTTERSSSTLNGFGSIADTGELWGQIYIFDICANGDV